MRIALLGLAACALAACGTSNPSPSAGPASLPTQAIGTSDGINISTSTEVRVLSSDIAAPVDRVWAVLPGVYEQLGLQGASSDPARRTVSTATSFTRRFLGEQATRYVDCGTGSFGTPIAQQYTIRMTITTTVNPAADGSGSRLDNMVEARAFSTDGANAVAAQCRTQGRLEQMISTLVQGKIAS
jgi:hypothetical protein